MALCEKCGIDVKKLTVHGLSTQKLCLRCISESGYYDPHDDDLVLDEERRASIRIPLTVTLDFSLPGASGRTNFPGYTVDISMSGLCFAWDSCTKCTGYAEKGIHPDCALYPYFIENPDREALKIDLKIMEAKTTAVEAYVIHAVREEVLNLEYVGAQFTGLPNQDRRIIEKLIIKYA